MPVVGQDIRGDLHVSIKVVLPDKLTAAQKKQIKALQRSFA
jgi:DnaJ-class molecular chaperone